jgi:hypothetical protein
MVLQNAPVHKSLFKKHAASSFFRWAALTLALAAVAVWPTASLATEGGAGHYIPGALATLIDLPPTKPGWVIEAAYLQYQGDATGDVPIAGEVGIDLDAKSDAVLLGGFYTPEQTVLGARFSAGVFLPYVWISLDADVDTPSGTIRQKDDASGIGDMTLIPAMMAWESGFWQFNTILSVYAPTGDYKKERLANPGLNYWTFDPIIGASYNNDRMGLNAALHGGISLNTENKDTDYQSGSMLHFDGSVQQLLPVGSGFLGLGAEAFYMEQITGDSGSGATFGNFKGHTVGIGPVLTYVLPREEESFVVELRWLPELDVKNRLEGDYFWLKFVYQF